VTGVVTDPGSQILKLHEGLDCTFNSAQDES
jgi:hypothetical protein